MLQSSQLEDPKRCRLVLGAIYHIVQQTDLRINWNTKMTASGAFIETMNPNRINVTVRQTEGQSSYLDLKTSLLSKLTVEDKMWKYDCA